MERAINERYRRLDVLPFAAAYVDEAGTIRTANQAFLSVWLMCGGDLGAIDRASLLTVIDPAHREAVQAILAVPRVLPQSCSRQIRVAGGSGLLAELTPVRRRSEPCTTWLVILRADTGVHDPTVSGFDRLLSAHAHPGHPLLDSRHQARSKVQ